MILFMDDNLYRDIILEHWKNPQNFGLLKDPDFDAEMENPFCGDRLRLMLNFKQNHVNEVAFTGEGCAISMASASMLTEELKGKSIEEIKKLDSQFILDLLGIKLTPTRLKCALLIYEAVKKGLRKNYS